MALYASVASLSLSLSMYVSLYVAVYQPVLQSKSVRLILYLRLCLCFCIPISPLFISLSEAPLLLPLPCKLKLIYSLIMAFNITMQVDYSLKESIDFVDIYSLTYSTSNSFVGPTVCRGNLTNPAVSMVNSAAHRGKADEIPRLTAATQLNFRGLIKS